jgi:hypothetical protein
MLDYNDESLGTDTDLPHHENLRRTEMRIMRHVRANSDDGIHHLDLARKLKINRKNLTPHMKRLMIKGLVMRGNGRQGKYYPVTRGNRELSVTADILGRVAVGTILEFYKAFPIDSPYFRSDEGSYPLDDGLFMFSNGIGAIITYCLIQSMNQSFDIPGRHARSDEEEDISVSSWFKDVLSTLGVILLVFFKQYMSAPLMISCNNYDKGEGTPDLYRAGMDFVKHLFKNPQYSYDEKFTTSLMTSFSRIYPSIYDQLDKINYRLPVAEFWETNHRDYEKISYWYQKKCRHKFSLPSNKSLSEKYENNLLHCSKCHKNTYIKNPFH